LGGRGDWLDGLIVAEGGVPDGGGEIVLTVEPHVFLIEEAEAVFDGAEGLGR